MKIHKIHYSAILVFGILCHTALGQTSDHHHHHEDHLYELGLSLGLAHLERESDNAFGTHLHLMRRMADEGPGEKAALGFGVEYLFTEHTHISFLGTFSYNLHKALWLDIAPGLLISEHEGETESGWIAHIEFTWEMDMFSIGLGPVLGVALSEEDRHYMIGIHIGRGL